MRYSSRLVFIPAALIIFICGQTVRSQSTEKWEIGGQFTYLRLSNPVASATTNIICNVPQCFTVPDGPGKNQAGFGGRIGYNITSNVAIEAELNFFPDVDSVGADDVFANGHQLQGLFGPKVGKRFEKIGIFAKARPGFLRVSNGDLKSGGGVCIAVFPPPAGCLEAISKTHFAVDVGGVFEIYPSKKTVLRFDAGDTIVRFGDRSVPVIFSPTSSVFALPVKAGTTHNFQANVGFAYRF